MKKRNTFLIIKSFLLIGALLLAGLYFSNSVYAKKNYTITPKKVEKSAKLHHKSTWTKYTKHYMGINDYLEKMRKAGGGTLTIKKGKYNISNALYVPSNVTIVFEDGVVFKKINKTGSSLKASGSMWQICPKNKSKKANSIGGYSGANNVKFIGKGKVLFHMNGITGITIVAAHNQNIEISGITFAGMNGNHYIEVNGTKNAYIHDCKFGSSKVSTRSKYYMKEAINIDLADAKTGGLPLKWVKKDKTPCLNIKIENNVFDGTTRGVGSHKFSQNSNGENVYHTNITINNNYFNNIYDNGVFVLNWNNTVITNNTFYNIGKTSTKTYASGKHGISGGGLTGITITGNVFSMIERNPIYFSVQQNVGGGSDYKNVGVHITDEETKLMLNNSVTNCGNDMNSIFAGYDVLYFRGDGQRTRENAVGIDLNKKVINYYLTK